MLYSVCLFNILQVVFYHLMEGGRFRPYRIVVGITTTCAISAYHL